MGNPLEPRRDVTLGNRVRVRLEHRKGTKKTGPGSHMRSGNSEEEPKEEVFMGKQGAYKMLL